MKGNGPRSFDPVVIGHRETECWAGYYRHEWGRVLLAALGMVAEGFGMGRRRTIAGSWHVLRANQAWAPYPDNDPDAAKRHMQRFYQLVADDGGLSLDPSHAATLELHWWRLHRAHQHDPGINSGPADPVPGRALQLPLCDRPDGGLPRRTFARRGHGPVRPLGRGGLPPGRPAARGRATGAGGFIHFTAGSRVQVAASRLPPAPGTTRRNSLRSRTGPHRLVDGG